MSESGLTSLLHELLQPVRVLDVGTRLGVVLSTVLEDQVGVVKEVVQGRVEIRVELEFHRREVCKGVGGKRRGREVQLGSNRVGMERR